jgi:hypothetical protein
MKQERALMSPSENGPAGYPVQVMVDREQRINQLWGIPILGQTIRSILVIPQLIYIWLLGVLAGLSVLITWIPILLSGRLPGWAISLYVDLYRWTLRVAAYVMLMAAPYPGFSLSDTYPVDLVVATPADRSISRLWGIPLLGLMVRAFCVIPQSVILFFVSIIAWLVALVAWIPVLLTGRFPGFGYTVYGGYLRLTARISLWSLFYPADWPPFTIES